MDLFGRKYSWNDAEEDGGKKIVFVRVDKTLFKVVLPKWRGLGLLKHGVILKSEEKQLYKHDHAFIW